MAVNIDITARDPAGVDADIETIIKNVCGECAPEYDDNLYAGVHLTGNAEIQEINSRFREIDKATDVLSFPLLTAKNGEISYSDFDRVGESGAIMIGDIVISVDKAREQAYDYGHSFKREIAFLACHGMLHLLGYDHESDEDEKTMIEKQKSVLNRLGYLK